MDYETATASIRALRMVKRLANRKAFSSLLRGDSEVHNRAGCAHLTRSVNHNAAYRAINQLTKEGWVLEPFDYRGGPFYHTAVRRNPNGTWARVELYSPTTGMSELTFSAA